MVADPEELERYPWSGHAVLLGKRTMEGQETAEVLARFGKNKDRAARLYRQFVADGITAGHRDDLMGGGLKRSQPDGAETGEIAAFDERILGSGEFVEMLTQGASAGEPRKPRLTLAELLAIVCSVTGVSAEQMQRPGKERAVARAKAIYCCLAVRENGFTGTEAGKVVKIASAGASIAVRRGSELLKSDPELQHKIQKGGS
jgi:hypothetical protein